MNTLSMHLTALMIEGERGIPARPVRAESKSAPEAKMVSAIERQLDVIKHTFSPRWEW